MDKPSGPRQPPDKRHAAYESIFGRSHQHPQYLSQQPQNQPYLYSQQPYQNNIDRRSSFSPPHAYNQNPYPPPPPPHPNSGAYGQPYYPTQPSPPQPYHQIQQQFPYPTSLAPPNQTVARARSVISNAGVIPPSPNGLPDHTLGIPSQSGMTIAQAYQAQIHNHGSAGTKYHFSPGPPDRASYPQSQNGVLGQPVDTPRMGISLEHDDGRLGVNFGGGSANNSGDEGSSELPWAVNEHTPVRKAHRSTQHLRQSSIAESTYSNFSLHVDTNAAQAIRSSVTTASPSSASSTAEGSATLVEHDPRRSTESSRTLPKFSTVRSRAGQDRSMSMSTAGSIKKNHDQRRSSKPPIPPSFHEGRNSPASVRPSKKTPIVYPALLSRVAEAFRERIPLMDRVKDGLTYKDTFDGREAVDKIAYIIKTADRNLALLLGRALDAQKFFHDVTYDHRLRDSANELYQFRTILPSPFVGGELPSPPHDPAAIQKGLRHLSIQSDASPQEEEGPDSAAPPTLTRKDSLSSDEAPLPSGVFTLLTDCYSPTCSRDQLCYSIACPRRLEQQARLNMKPQPGLSKQISRESLGDVPDDGTLWIHSVPQEILNSVSDAEKRRQEAINEVIYTERDFVRDMEYLRDVWMNRLKESDIIPQSARQEFITTVFWNIEHIIAVNTRLRDALNKRQKSYAVVEKIGDIFLDAVPHFSPFVSYGGHQLAGKDRFEKEKSSNPAFAAFVESTEGLPESRRLELNAYLTKPTTRLARYPLLLEAVLKHTPDDSPDKHVLPQVVKMVREFLTKVNTESGKAENRASLQKLNDALFFKQGEEVDLRLLEEGREMVHKGVLSKRDGELQVFLLDHAMLFTKLAKGKQQEQYKVYRRPIPLELLLITAAEEATASIRNQQRRNGGGGMPNVVSAVAARHEAKGQHWINFVYLGRKCYNLMLWADSALLQRKWLESIFKQQQAMRERSMIFDTVTLSEGFFSGPNKVNCAAPFDRGRSIVYGTDDGVYISSFTSPENEPVKVLALLDVLQVDVLEEYELLIVLSERQVITFPLEALDKRDPMAGLRRAKRISSHTSFFKAGFCLGRVLVCIVKSSQLSSTFKTLEPIDQNIRGRAKPTFRKLLQGGNDTLKMFREFYIPVESTSIHYLKTKMCVGCSKGFEIVDLETLDTQGLLDPHDESLDFVRRRDNLRPMAIYRIHNEFLLCYDEFAFYVNKNGRRSRLNFMVQWEGQPTGFALHEPYVLAFEPSFVEIRHIETGLLSQVIQGFNLRLLFADTPPSVTNTATQQYNPHQGYQPYGNYGHITQQAPYISQPRHIQGVGRDEILIVSEDRVLALRTAAGPQRFMSDDGSMMSMPR